MIMLFKTVKSLKSVIKAMDIMSFVHYHELMDCIK